MEEILSSIRRIIADEEADGGKADEDAELGAAEARRQETHQDDDEDDDDVLELTKVVRDGGEVVDLRNEQAASAKEPHREEAQGAPEDAAPPPADHATDDAATDDDIELEPAAQEHATPGGPTYASEERPKVSASPAAAQELISESAATAATGAFAKLSHAMQRTAPEESIADDSGRTIEQFIEDMIRPMLKDWLDENMPALVERLVEKEIQKLARRSELM